MTTITKLTIIASVTLITGCASTVYKTDGNPDQFSRQYFLPKGEVNLKLERGNDGDPIAITITPRFVADTTAKLYIHRDHSSFYDDQYVIETDKNSLLKAINTTNNFQGDEIIKKVGEIAGKVVQLTASNWGQSKLKFVDYDLSLLVE